MASISLPVLTITDYLQLMDNKRFYLGTGGLSSIYYYEPSDILNIVAGGGVGKLVLRADDTISFLQGANTKATMDSAGKFSFVEDMALSKDLLMQATKTVDGVDVSAEPARITAEIDADVLTHKNINDAHHVKYTDAEVDAIVLTHKNINDAHHVKYTDAEVDAIVLTHKNINDAHHVKYTDGEVDAIVLTHKNLATAHQDAPALILTHKNINDAHHVKYTDGEVETVIDQEIVGGQSIDNAINTLIDAHEAQPTVHQDAPALIATHTAIEAAHGMELDDLTDVTMTGSRLHDITTYLPANATWVPIIPIGDQFNAAIFAAHNRVYSNGINGAFDVHCMLMIPTKKGALKLYLDDVRFGMIDADVNDYITRLTLQGGYSNGNHVVTIQLSNTNYTTTGAKVWARNPTDVSGYDFIILKIGCIASATAGDLQFAHPQILCYYGA